MICWSVHFHLALRINGKGYVVQCIIDMIIQFAKIDPFTLFQKTEQLLAFFGISVAHEKHVTKGGSSVLVPSGLGYNWELGGELFRNVI